MRFSRHRTARGAVVLVGLVVLGLKLVVATHTPGTQDVETWRVFAEFVHERGPVGVYAVDFDQVNGTLYNHPPLIGYLLAAASRMTTWGVPVSVTLRALSSIADVICALIVFEILRRRASLTRAVLCGVAVAASPILFLVSGYHGNTDPLLMSLVWLGCFLIVDRRLPMLGGAALALAIGVKLVAVVVLPVICVYLLRQVPTRYATRAGIGFLAVFLSTWGPAVAWEWPALRDHVLGYSGISDRPWGLVKLADAAHWSWGVQLLTGPGRFAVLLLCGLLPALLAWRRPERTMVSAALGLVAFLVLTPAFGVQYLAWVVAAAYLLDAALATVYNLVGGLLLFVLYNHWNNGLPWDTIAKGQPFTPFELLLAGAAWFTLVGVLARGAERAAARTPHEAESLPSLPRVTPRRRLASPDPSPAGLGTRE